jgi:hypothetical protein
MATSALPSLINAVITRLKADSNLSSVRVFDGIEIDQSYPGDAICIGHNGNMEGDEVVASNLTQEYRNLGAVGKFEDGILNCTMWAWDGTTDISARRTRATQVLGYVENSIRSDVSFGGVVIYSGIDAAQMIYRQTTGGAAVVINFSITYRAKI